MIIPSILPTISTIVRSLKVVLIRLNFRFVGLLSPDAAARKGADLFCTPWASSRTRAQAVEDSGAVHRMISIDEQTLATYVWGDPQTQPYALFAHGWSSHGLRHQAWVDALRSAGYAVVAFDQQGHGRSSGRLATLPDFACNLIAIAHRFGPAAAVIGHSLGGAAVAIALSEGLKAERAILIAPVADPVDATRRFARFIRLAGPITRRMTAVLEGRTRVPMDDVQAHRIAPLIARPALLVHDLEDAEVPWCEGERYARYWPESRLLTTTGLGHHRIAHDPGVIAASLQFLRGETVGERVVSSPNLPYGLA